MMDLIPCRLDHAMAETAKARARSLHSAAGRAMGTAHIYARRIACLRH